MSRASGFIVTFGGEELFHIGWKNYLNVDSSLWGFGWDNHLFDDKSKDDENTSLITNFDGLEKLYQYLCNTQDYYWWDKNDIMEHTKEEAVSQWFYIRDKIKYFLRSPWTDAVKSSMEVEFYSCC